MKIPSPISYKRHRYPAAIISQCVWLYFRFALSFRDVELMMAQRGVVVSYESIRSWCEKFGRQYSRKIRRQRGRMVDVWHLDEVYLKITTECASNCGVQWIKRVKYWTFWFSLNRIKLLLSGSSKRCCVAHAKHQDKWSQIGWLPTLSPVQRSCPMQPISGTKEQTIEQRTHVNQPASESAG